MVAGTLALALSTGLLVAAGLDHAATSRTDGRVAAAQGATRRLLAVLATTDAQLRLRVQQGTAAGAVLRADEAQLARDRQTLVTDRAALYATGIAISQLGSCLDAAQAAVNQLALGYASGAVASVQSATRTCAEAQGAGGA